MAFPTPAAALPAAAPVLMRRWRLSLFTLFLVLGIATASWVTRTPALRGLLDASLTEMGMVLFGASVGAMAGLLAATPLVRRFGTRRVALGGLLTVAAGVAGIGLGAAIASTPVVWLALCLFGIGTGCGDIAINIQGAELEKRQGRTVMASLHGCFSLGTLCGALLGIGLNHLAFPVHWHLWGAGLLCLAGIGRAAAWLPPEAETAAPPEGARSSGGDARTPPWRDRRLLLIGLVIMAMALAEGSATDWLPILMVDEYGFDPAGGALIYAGFAAGMTVGRFGGARVLQRVGRGAAVRGSTLCCAIGLAMAIFAHHPLVAALSVLFWGLGASLGFPLAISAAGDSGPDAARRVGFVAVAGYFSFLVGPPALGFLGEHYGLRGALVAVLVLALGAVLAAPATRQAAGAVRG